MQFACDDLTCSHMLIYIHAHRLKHGLTLGTTSLVCVWSWTCFCRHHFPTDLLLCALLPLTVQPDLLPSHRYLTNERSMTFVTFLDSVTACFIQRAANCCSAAFLKFSYPFITEITSIFPQYLPCDYLYLHPPSKHLQLVPIPDCSGKQICWLASPRRVHIWTRLTPHTVDLTVCTQALLPVREYLPENLVVFRPHSYITLHVVESLINVLICFLVLRLFLFLSLPMFKIGRASCRERV